MSIKVVTFFFSPPVINIFQFPFFIIIKIITQFSLSFFSYFLTIPFHEYQSCHIFPFFFLVINLFQFPFLLSRLSHICFLLILSFSFSCSLLSSLRLWRMNFFLFLPFSLKIRLANFDFLLTGN